MASHVLSTYRSSSQSLFRILASSRRIFPGTGLTSLFQDSHILSPVRLNPSVGLEACWRRQQSSTPEDYVDMDDDGSPVKSEPMLFDFTSIPPDTTACRLSDETKETIFKLHKESPGVWTVQKLAQEYRIRQQRVHAILWLKEVERDMEEENGGEPLDDSIQKTFDEWHDATVVKAVGERHIKMYPTPQPPELAEEEKLKQLFEESDKEEAWKVEEFVKRMTFNKKQYSSLRLQMDSVVKVNKLSRRRPAEGWSYLVEELGEDAKRGKRGGRRFVVQGDGSKRSLNDLEKEFLEREAPRPRRRIVPRS